MNLHITHDDKFMDYFIQLADKVATIPNKYIIYTSNNTIKHTKSSNIIVVKINSPEFYEAIGDLRQYDAVFLHYLSDVLLDLVEKAPNGIKFVWMFFGGDGFRHTSFDNQYYQPITSKAIDKIHIRNIKDIIHWHPKQFWWHIQVYRFHQKTAKQTNKQLEKVAHKISYFCHYIPEDFEILSTILNTKNMKYVEFNYGTMEAVIGNIPTSPIQNNNILIGNSEACTANHLDALHKLKTIGIKDRQIFMPLSYGYESEREYKEYVIKEGKKLFGSDFIPITDFMSKQDYHEQVLFQCAYIIMNHDRSQAGANNIVALYAGQKLFMSNRSTLYRFYQSLGCSVSDFQASTLTDFNIPLSDSEIQQNRYSINEYYKQTAVELRYQKMFEQINGK